MLLEFKKGRDKTKTATIAHWEGVVILLPTGEIGNIDVMFTGVSKSGKAIFAKPVEGTKVESEGFTTLGSMCCTGATSIDGKIHFTPGLLNPVVYSANYATSSKTGCLDFPVLSGIFYIEKYQGRDVCIGVDDPSLLSDFINHNKQYNDFVSKYGFKVGQHRSIKTYTGNIESVIINETDNYPLHALCSYVGDTSSFYISIDDVVE
jgi:hypothetical protein